MALPLSGVRGQVALQRTRVRTSAPSVSDYDVHTMSTAAIAVKSGRPLWLRIIGWGVLPGIWAFAARMIWEATILSWNAGPQMIGFTLMHVYVPVFLWMILSFYGGHGFLLLWLIMLVLSRSRRIRWIDWGQAALVFVSLLPLSVPLEWWTVAAIKVKGPGAHGAQFLSTAAADGDLLTLRVLIWAGVPVDAPNRAGGTALDNACSNHDEAMTRFLIQRGADIARAPTCK